LRQENLEVKPSQAKVSGILSQKQNTNKRAGGVIICTNMHKTLGSISVMEKTKIFVFLHDFPSSERI
jgi:hypothetical protein